jgi:hypothetical protein
MMTAAPPATSGVVIMGFAAISVMIILRIRVSRGVKVLFSKRSAPTIFIVLVPAIVVVAFTETVVDVRYVDSDVAVIEVVVRAVEVVKTNEVVFVVE